MSKKNADRAVLALFSVMAVLLYNSTAGYTGIAIETSAKYVQFLAVFIGLLSVINLVFSMFQNINGDKLVLTEHIPRFIGLLIALVIFAALFERLGFFVPAAVFIPVVAVILGYRRPVTIVLTTVGVLLFVYLVFIKLLSVNLPGFIF
ncbi:MAG: tripartite tricarboxylate transporter TctB family protein [Sedimenticola sp.]